MACAHLGQGDSPAVRLSINHTTLPCLQVQELGTKLLQAALALHDRVMATFRRTAVTFHYE